MEPPSCGCVYVGADGPRQGQVDATFWQKLGCRKRPLQFAGELKEQSRLEKEPH